MKYQTFTLPDVPASLSASDKVIIVAIVGKSTLSAQNDKGGLLTDPLRGPKFGKRVRDKVIPGCQIEGYFDEERKIVFLHLASLYDTYNLYEAFKEHNKITEKNKDKSNSTQTEENPVLNINNEAGEGKLKPESELFETETEFFQKLTESGDYLTVYNEIKVNFARSLLFLFNVCHILVVTHPGNNFDLGYIHMFRALDTIRQKFLPQTSECLREAGVTSRWYQAGRLCPPRVLFYFERRTRSDVEIKKLEHSLEDQIYHILRKTRVVTNISANSLFSIPKNEEFVYINTNSNLHNDKVAHAVRALITSCQKKSNSNNIFDTFGRNPYINSDGSIKNSSTNDAPVEERNFLDFLQKHIDIAFTTGFEDNVGKYATNPSHFEVPKLPVWIASIQKLHNLYHNYDTLENRDLADNKSNMINSLREQLNVDVRFSENRCAKVLPVAQANYMENLPGHYSKSYHEDKLSVALSVFNAHARGPRCASYAEKLRKECLQHWTQGRQLCEEPSLTNHPCILPKHEVTGLDSPEHSSGVVLMSTCDCGRTQGRREDPYSVRQANYDFYTLLARDCVCKSLERAVFPVFQPSTHDFRAAQLFNKTSKHHVDESCLDTSEQDFTPQTQDSRSETHQSTDMSLDNSPGDLDCKSTESDEKNDSDVNEIVIKVSDNDTDLNKDKSLVRQPSTTEYLPGMLHTQSPIGLLPQFPSWSLVCVGSSSLYSHNLGLSEAQHPGFIAGTNFLLPWDVTVRLEHTQPWPSMLERNRSRKPHKPYTHAIPNTSNEFVVKIFVGIEYECPRGHRFMMSAPDKILRSSSGPVKDSGNRVTSSDMPLFFECPCRTNKPQMAQLMRVHVVSPKAPVHVTLDPKVQPGTTNSPIFITGIQSPVKLTQSSYWVLRLPYIYIGDRGVIPSPTELNHCGLGDSQHSSGTASFGRLLSGMYGISEMERE